MVMVGHIEVRDHDIVRSRASMGPAEGASQHGFEAPPEFRSQRIPSEKGELWMLHKAVKVAHSLFLLELVQKKHIWEEEIAKKQRLKA